MCSLGRRVKMRAGGGDREVERSDAEREGRAKAGSRDKNTDVCVSRVCRLSLGRGEENVEVVDDACAGEHIRRLRKEKDILDAQKKKKTKTKTKT